MKKYIKNLVCILCVISTVVLCCVGCKKGNNDNNETITPTTIALSEAKDVVINALSIVEDAQQLSIINCVANNMVSSTSGNRNIFAKMSSFNIDIELQGQSNINGKAERKGLAWKKYSLANDNCKEYYDGTQVYQQAETNNVVEFQNSYYGQILQALDCLYIDILFIDEAWSSIYNNLVSKTPTKDGYTYSMDIKMSDYVFFATSRAMLNGLSLEGLFGDIGSEIYLKTQQEGGAELILTFDKLNRITKLDFEIESFGSDFDGIIKTKTKISVSKSLEGVSQPDWVINN